MIKDFRMCYKLTQKQLAEKTGIAERTIRWYEMLERKNKLKDTPNVNKLKIFMVAYRVQNFATKTYEDNSKLIAQANKSYKPCDNTITSVLPVKQKSLLTRLWEWLICKA